jgi:adenylate cyclase
MFSITVVNEKQNQQYEHDGGPLELGRGPQKEAPRVLIEDIYTSKNQLRIEELGAGHVRLTNLSQRTRVDLSDGTSLPAGESRDVGLPLNLTFGATRVKIDPGPYETFDESSLQTINEPLRPAHDPRQSRPLGPLGDTPSPETIAAWLETVLALQQTAADAPEFFPQTARALVELVNLDVGLVLLQRSGVWDVAGSHVINDRLTPRFSRTLLNRVLAERRTFFQDARSLEMQTQSLANLDYVVASPIFGVRENIVGALYGVRAMLGRRPGGIRPLEAQLVQLLAAAAGANLARTQATRTRTQFEQFFSAELVRELERDPGLLEGRNQEVTILVSDLRGFTSLSERLGPETTCRILRDLMERLSEPILEHKGVIVDFAGDGILAMWNAPVPQEDHVARGCRAALAMLAALPDLSAKWQATVGEPLSLGIGVITGPAVVGNTGCSRKLKYGPHGHTVNLASRIQDATKKLAAPMLISSATRDRLPSAFECRRLPPVELPGVAGPTVLFQLQGERAPRPRQDTQVRPSSGSGSWAR